MDAVLKKLINTVVGCLFWEECTKFARKLESNLSMKKILFSAVLVLSSLFAQAQNATNSPYSQYGYGTLADQANGASVAMSGLSLGWREGNAVNFGNPASYSALDSVTFIFDAGVSAQITSFNEGTQKLNAKNTSFDYIVGGFRLFRHVGVGFGVMPYSNVGYNYYNQSTIGQSSATGDSKTVSSNTYVGSGGFHQLFLGIGVEPIHTGKVSVSLGANGSYFWGDYSRSVVNAYTDAYVNTLSKYYVASVKTYKVDIAAQLQYRFSKSDMVTLGATYTIGHEMSSDPKCLIISTNSQTSVADTTTLKSNAGLSMPTAFGAGFVWNHAGKWRVGFDWKMEKWGSLKYPQYEVSGGEPSYVNTSGLFSDRQRYVLGAEFCPNEKGLKRRDHVRYRAGVTYTSPYLKINGLDGPKEYGVSLGVGLPVMNGYNNRSMLNISASWTRLDAANLIKENTFRINIGFTFNERWFAKWQVE